MISWFCMSIHLLSTVFQEIRQLQRENAGEPSAQHVQHLPFWDTQGSNAHAHREQDLMGFDGLCWALSMVY